MEHNILKYAPVWMGWMEWMEMDEWMQIFMNTAQLYASVHKN